MFKSVSVVVTDGVAVIDVIVATFTFDAKDIIGISSVAVITSVSAVTATDVIDVVIPGVATSHLLLMMFQL